MINSESDIECFEQKSNSQLTILQKSFIILKLKEGMKCNQVLESWDPIVLERCALSIQTIRKIKHELKKNGVLFKKKGPKTKHVLTPQKLIEVEITMTKKRCSNI